MKSRRPAAQPSNRKRTDTPFVYPHHVRDLKGALGSSIGSGYDVLQKQLWKLHQGGTNPRA